MSVVISNGPTNGNLYAIDTMPTIIVSSDEGIDVILLFKQSSAANFSNDDIAFNGVYTPDFEGKVYLDFSDIYENYAKTIIPNNASDVLQSYFLYDYQIIVKGLKSSSELTRGFTVANSRIKEIFGNIHVNSIFLTGQPKEKHITYDSPEWITWVDTVGNYVLKARFYPKTGGSEEEVLYTDTSEGCFSFSTAFKNIITHTIHTPNQLLGYYDVILYDSYDNILDSQRYICKKSTEKEKYFVFVNPAGGIDTIICQGENVLQPALEFNTAQIGGALKPIKSFDNVREWKQNTGRFPWRERNWINGLLTEQKEAAQFNTDTQVLTPIVITDAQISMSDVKELSTASFSYKFTEAGENNLKEQSNGFTSSAIQESQEIKDLTTHEEKGFSEGDDGYETEEEVINANKVYVSFDSGITGTIYYLVNGERVGSFDASTAQQPIVIEINPGETLQFVTENEVTSPIRIQYYEVEGAEEVEAENEH